MSISLIMSPSYSLTLFVCCLSAVWCWAGNVGGILELPALPENDTDESSETEPQPLRCRAKKQNNELKDAKTLSGAQGDCRVG